MQFLIIVHSLYFLVYSIIAGQTTSCVFAFPFLYNLRPSLSISPNVMGLQYLKYDLM